jgi:2-polyprenyl-3-methyl-5-hydroxy-6-metoxy-1,4-benzoquinol methylase
MKRFQRFLSSVDPNEMKQFSRVASEWWNPKGPYQMLLRMNPVRVSFIRSHIPSTNLKKPFENLNILDIGCGGGFLSQSLKRLGANVTAVDANWENIQVAKAYDTSNINFIHGTAEDLQEQFDIVCGLEIVEHVTDPKEFIKTCSNLCKVFMVDIAWWIHVFFNHQQNFDFVFGYDCIGRTRFAMGTTRYSFFSKICYSKRTCSIS